MDRSFLLRFEQWPSGLADPMPTPTRVRTLGAMVSLPETKIGVFDAAVGSTPAYARVMLAGSVAGVVAKTALAPLGRLKLLPRIGGAPGAEAGGAVRTLVGIYRREGFVGLYRGNGANALRVFRSKALHFAAYERSMGWLGGGGGGALVDLLVGSAAGGTALLATYPLDLARARLACGGGEAARSSVRGDAGDAMQAISKHIHPGINEC